MRGIADEEVLSIIEGTTKPSMARFYMGIMPDDKATVSEGRPVFKEVPFVRIQIPGDKDNVFDQPAWIDPRQPNAHNNRFPREWSMFQNGQKEQLVGTPLSVWPGMTKPQVLELEYFGLRTVEQLAAVSDGNLQKLPPGTIALIQKAKDYLEASKGTAHLTSMRAELDQRDAQIKALERSIQEIITNQSKAAPVAPAGDNLAAQMEELKRSILGELRAQPIAAQAEAAPKKRGRPFSKKQEVTEHGVSNG